MAGNQSLSHFFGSIWRLIHSTSPIDQLLRIEINLFVTIIIVALIFFLGLIRRSCRSSLVRYLLFVAYVGFFSLISYTMGMIHDSTFRHALFAVWAGFVLIAYGSVDTMVAYSLQDHENRRRYFLELCLLGFWFLWLIYMYNYIPYFQMPIQILWILMFYKTGERLQAFELACQSGLAKFAKPTADCMRREHEETVAGEVVDPISMRGYKYLLEDPVVEGDFVTLDRLWQFEGKILCNNGNHSAKLKDICLSFALCKLLLRRFARYTVYEASTEKTWKFVRYGLLGDQEEYVRPFEVIEGELHFLHDFFYTKYCILGTDGSFLRKTIQMVLYLGCSIYVTVQLHYHPLEAEYPTVNMHGHVLDVWVTVIALIVISFLEILQFTMLMLSEWTIVRWLVHYVKTPKSVNKFQEIVLTKLVPLAYKYPFKLKPWARKLGQYTFLDNYAHVPFMLRFGKIISPIFSLSKIMTPPRIGQIEGSDIDLSEEVKRAVIESLKAYNDEHGPPKLTNGITSLSRNGVINNVSWACHLETQAQVVMVWHIATTIICKASTPNGASTTDIDHQNFHTAMSLSSYCAYLVAFAPGLLAEHPYATECMFDDLVVEARKFLGEKDVSMGSKLQKLLGVKEEDFKGSTALKQAGLLAQTLLNEVQDRAHIWKVLAEFWAELILFLAPSGNAEPHAEHLVKGGEFITHLWALLTHAGILNTKSD